MRCDVCVWANEPSETRRKLKHSWNGNANGTWKIRIHNRQKSQKNSQEIGILLFSIFYSFSFSTLSFWSRFSSNFCMCVWHALQTQSCCPREERNLICVTSKSRMQTHKRKLVISHLTNAHERTHIYKFKHIILCVTHFYMRVSFFYVFRCFLFDTSRRYRI